MGQTVQNRRPDRLAQPVRSLTDLLYAVIICNSGKVSRGPGVAAKPRKIVRNGPLSRQVSTRAPVGALHPRVSSIRPSARARSERANPLAQPGDASQVSLAKPIVRVKQDRPCRSPPSQLEIKKRTGPVHKQAGPASAKEGGNLRRCTARRQGKEVKPDDALPRTSVL